MRGACDVFLQIEWFEVGHVLLLPQVEGAFCQGEHPFCQGHDAFQEVGVGVSDDALALCGSVAEEPDGVLFEVGQIGVCLDDVCSDGAHLAEGTVIDGAIDFHSPCIYHGYEQGFSLPRLFRGKGERSVILPIAVLPSFGGFGGGFQQHGHAEQLQRRHGEQRQVAPVADAFCQRDADAQPGVAAGAFAHGHGIDGDGVAVGKREGFLDKHSAHGGVVRSVQVFLVEDEAAVLAQGYGAGLGTCLNM